MTDLIGKTLLGKYRVVEGIGQGHIAMVYKAFQPALERYVAVKVLDQQLAVKDERCYEHLRREAKAVACLRHPHILQVFDFGIEDGVACIVMEYLEGINLKARLDALAVGRERIPLDEVWRIARAVASALEYAHGKGMVHRDIKPTNVMLGTRGGIVLTDFGIANMVEAIGAIIGTPAYLAPEQVQGGRGDERSDIYALGVMLYEMVAGRLPFEADTPLAVIERHVNAPPLPPRQLNPAIPQAAEQIILRTLATNPDDRFQKAADLAEALGTFYKSWSPRLPPHLHVDFSLTGKVSALLDRGFSVHTDGGATVIVSTLSRGDQLGLRPGDYVRIFGGPDRQRGVFLAGTISKVLPNGKAITVKDEPDKGKKPE